MSQHHLIKGENNIMSWSPAYCATLLNIGIAVVDI